MPRIGGRLVLAFLVAAITAPGATARTGAPRSDSSQPVDARIVGTFTMHAHVTAAVNVPGERVGGILSRAWTIFPSRCRASVCQRLLLVRERSDHQHDRLTLARVGRGEYAGAGTFYVGLSCLGKVYTHGSRVPYRITLDGSPGNHGGWDQLCAGPRCDLRQPGTFRCNPVPARPQPRCGPLQRPTQLPAPHPADGVVLSDNRPLHKSGIVQRHLPARSRRLPIVSRRWRFGDSASGAADMSTLAAPVHRFSSPGTYVVSLTLLDANGLSSTGSEQITASGPPTATFAYTRDGAQPDSFSFNDQSRPGIGGGAIAAWSWQFDDPGSGAANSSTLQDPHHTFTQPGSYTVTLTVTDVNGRASTTTAQLAAPGPPGAAFAATEQGSTATFSFNDESTPGFGGAAIVSWQWDFGDPASGPGDTSATENPSHTFTAAGTYSVTLTVTDAEDDVLDDATSDLRSRERERGQNALELTDQPIGSLASRLDHRVEAARSASLGEEALPSELTAPGDLQLCGAEVAGPQRPRAPVLCEQAVSWLQFVVAAVLH